MTVFCSIFSIVVNVRWHRRLRKVYFLTFTKHRLLEFSAPGKGLNLKKKSVIIIGHHHGREVHTVNSFSNFSCPVSNSIGESLVSCIIFLTLQVPAAPKNRWKLKFVECFECLKTIFLLNFVFYKLRRITKISMHTKKFSQKYEDDRTEIKESKQLQPKLTKPKLSNCIWRQSYHRYCDPFVHQFWHPVRLLPFRQQYLCSYQRPWRVSKLIVFSKQKCKKKSTKIKSCP